MPSTTIKGQSCEVKGIYLDDNLSGTIVRRNLFVNVMRSVFIGGGRDNEVSANIFLKPRIAAIHVDDRGLNSDAHDIANPDSQLRGNLVAVPYQAEPYRSRYPGLANILDDEPGSPKNNRLGPNMVLEGKPYEMSASIMRLQQLGPVLDERAVGGHALSGALSTLPMVSTQTVGLLPPPFDLPFSEMDRKFALRTLKYIKRR